MALDQPAPSDNDLRNHIGNWQELSAKISDLKQKAPPVYLRVKTFKHRQALADLESERDHTLAVIHAITEEKYPRNAPFRIVNPETPEVMINQLLDILGHEPVQEPRRYRGNPFKTIPGA